MNQWNTPERQALRESVTRFTEREIVPNIAQWEDDGELPRSLSKAAAAAGILGVGFSEEVGGEGGNAIDTAIVRSEEHTSELQSLMRISSAVFCLTKNTSSNQRMRLQPDQQRTYLTSGKS